MNHIEYSISFSSVSTFVKNEKLENHQEKLKFSTRESFSMKRLGSERLPNKKKKIPNNIFTYVQTFVVSKKT